MPILELESDAGLAWTQVWAVMYLPSLKDDSARRQFMHAHHVKELGELEQLRDKEDVTELEEEQSDSIYRLRLAAFFRDGGFPELWKVESPALVLENALAHQVRGMTAGQILLCLLAFANSRRRREHATVRRAIEMIMQTRKEKPLLHGGKKVPAGRSSIKQAWSQFKPVAHLWAAVRLERGPSAPTGLGDSPLGRLLATAEGLAAHAEELGVPWASDEKCAWRVAPGTPLPEVEFQIPSLNRAKLLVSLRSYRRLR